MWETLPNHSGGIQYRHIHSTGGPDPLSEFHCMLDGNELFSITWCLNNADWAFIWGWGSSEAELSLVHSINQHSCGQWHLIAQTWLGFLKKGHLISWAWRWRCEFWHCLAFSSESLKIKLSFFSILSLITSFWGMFCLISCNHTDVRHTVHASGIVCKWKKRGISTGWFIFTVLTA